MTAQEQTTIKLYWQAVNMHECIIAITTILIGSYTGAADRLRRRERRFETMMAENRDENGAHWKHTGFMTKAVNLRKAILNSEISARPHDCGIPQGDTTKQPAAMSFCGRAESHLLRLHRHMACLIRGTMLGKHVITRSRDYHLGAVLFRDGASQCVGPSNRPGGWRRRQRTAHRID